MKLKKLKGTKDKIFFSISQQDQVKDKHLRLQNTVIRSTFIKIHKFRVSRSDNSIKVS